MSGDHTRNRRQFNAEFKREAVQAAKRAGSSVAMVAKELELGDSVLRRWIRQFGFGRWEAARGNGSKAASTREFERVKRELDRVREVQMKRRGETS